MTKDQALGADSAGVWTTAQAVSCGLSEGAIARRVASGRWQRLRRSVYADGGVEPSPLMRGWAAVLEGGGPARACAGGRTTARLLGLPLIDDDDPATGAHDAELDDVVMRTPSGATARPTLRVHRLALTPRDTVLIDGCPSLTLERALAGLAAVLSLEALVCVLDAALHAGLTTEAALAAQVRRLAGRPQAVAVRRAVALADGRAESPNETLARLLLLPVLPGLAPQVQLFDARMRELARFDLGDEELKLAVEADGRAGHAGDHMVAKDRRRDRRTEALGWRPERVTWFELRRQRRATRARIVETAADLRRGVSGRASGGSPPRHAGVSRR